MIATLEVLPKTRNIVCKYKNFQQCNVYTFSLSYFNFPFHLLQLYKYKLKYDKKNVIYKLFSYKKSTLQITVKNLRKTLKCIDRVFIASNISIVCCFSIKALKGIFFLSFQKVLKKRQYFTWQTFMFYILFERSLF